MPLTAKGKKIMAKMRKVYGKRAKSVFYATVAKRRIKGVERRVRKKRK